MKGVNCLPLKRTSTLVMEGRGFGRSPADKALGQTAAPQKTDAKGNKCVTRIFFVHPPVCC